MTICPNDLLDSGLEALEAVTKKAVLSVGPIPASVSLLGLFVDSEDGGSVILRNAGLFPKYSST
jgi:hypothetical protein